MNTAPASDWESNALGWGRGLVTDLIPYRQQMCGYPHKLRMDNGPEFTSAVLAEWAEEHGIELEFIHPGKSTLNAYVERFNRACRDEIMNMYVFTTLTEVRELTEDWICVYNEERPHDALVDLAPCEYQDKHEQQENANLGCH